MQSTAPMLYAKSLVGVSYSAEPGVRVSCGNNAVVASSSTANNNSNTLDEIKSQFYAPEGLYRQMTISEYNCPPRVSLNQTVCPILNTLVRVSFVKVPLNSLSEHQDEGNNGIKDDYLERICFNSGREIFVYDYGSVNNSVDLTNPIDKRVYKGTFPTCHDFNQDTVHLHSSALLIGFTAGQVQLFDPYQKDFLSKLYNEERTIDKSPVTFVRWVPGQASLFAVSYASGNLYIYNEDYTSSPNPPVYQLLRQGDGYSTYSCKSKTPRNPIYKWSIGHGAINQFEFSDKEAKYLATVGQDGFLRIFNFKSMELLGYMKSYFGGLLCLAWSPDLRLIVTGGEDDLLSVYSVVEKRVVCRGQGHKSWVSQVAFDPYMSVIPPNSPTVVLEKKDEILLENPDSFVHTDNCTKRILTPLKNTTKISPCVSSENLLVNANKKTLIERPKNSISMKFKDSDDLPLTNQMPSNNLKVKAKKDSFNNTSLAWIAAGEKTSAIGGIDSMVAALNLLSKPSSNSVRTCYRIGSVGFDTQLCLWDLSGDVLNCVQEPVNYLTTLPTSLNNTEINPGLIPTVLTLSSLNSNSNDNKLCSCNTTVISIGLTKSFPRNDIAKTSAYDQNNAFIKAPSPSEVSTEDNSIAVQPLQKETKNKFKKLHKRGLSFGSRLNDRWSRSNGNSSILNGFSSNSSTTNGVSSSNNVCDVTLSLRHNGFGGNEWSTGIFGTAQCPRMDDVPVIEPLVCKKISHERLTVLHFRKNCLVTACQKGFILTWSRPETKAQRLLPIVNNNSQKFYINNSNADSDGTCV